MNIEPLESRIAPASGFFTVSADERSAFYTDVDGDRVTVKTSVGNFQDPIPGGSLEVEAGPLGNGSGYLRILDLSGPSFNRANITFSVVKVPGGDGLANVGAILGGTNDFGSIVVKGDLGQIDAGSNTAGTPAIKSLTVRSMGRFGIDTQMTDTGYRPPGPDYFVSTISGGLGALKVSGDVKDAWINVVSGSDGIGSVIIGGSLIGGSASPIVIPGLDQKSGVISSTGDIRMVKIGGDVRGGDARGGFSYASGAIMAEGNLLSVTIGGSLIGGSGPASGFIFSAKDMGAVKIGRNVVGGTDIGSGLIQSLGKLASVTIGGSLIGGSNSYTGEISSVGDLGVVKIGHDLIGGSISGSASLSRSGIIESSAGRIGSVTLGGSIISGSDTSSGALSYNGTIRAADDLGSLTVKGSLIGNVADGAAGNFSPVIISARGQETPKPGIDLAIGKITISDGVDFANILAGYQTDLTAINGDAQIGMVKVGGDWAASNLVAGAMNAASGNKIFGDGNEASIGAGRADITAKIASIVIDGAVSGRPGGATFGFVAEQIVSFKFNGTAVALAADAHTDKFAGVGLAGTARFVGPSLSATVNDGFAVHVFEV